MTDDPLLAALSEPVAPPPAELAEPEVVSKQAERPADAHPDQTAAIGVQVADLACAQIFAMPLDDGERAALQRDLSAVLGKYSVPDLPYQEEMALAMTTTGIVLKRVRAKRSDRSDSGQERVGEEPAVTGIHDEEAPVRSQCADFLP